MLLERGKNQREKRGLGKKISTKRMFQAKIIKCKLQHYNDEQGTLQINRY